MSALRPIDVSSISHLKINVFKYDSCIMYGGVSCRLKSKANTESVQTRVSSFFVALLSKARSPALHFYTQKREGCFRFTPVGLL